MGDDTYRLVLTIGPMFVVVGLVASAIAYAPLADSSSGRPTPVSRSSR